VIIPLSTWASWCWRSKDISASLAVLGKNSYLGHVWSCFRHVPYYRFLCQIISIVWYYRKHLQMSTVLNELPLSLWMIMKFTFIFIDCASSKLGNKYLPPYILNIFPYCSYFYYWSLPSLCYCAYVCPL